MRGTAAQFDFQASANTGRILPPLIWLASDGSDGVTASASPPPNGASPIRRWRMPEFEQALGGLVPRWIGTEMDPVRNPG